MRHTFLSFIAATFLLVACDKEKTTPITSANVTIDDITMNEGNGGTSTMDFTVKLSTSLSQEA
jgi:hypothetical protein